MALQSQRKWFAGGLLAGLLALGGAYTLYSSGNAAQSELTITGATPIEPIDAASTNAPPSSQPSRTSGDRQRLSPQNREITPGRPGPSSGSSRDPNSPLAPPEPHEIVVHVAGAVKRPGVYRFKPGQRADDGLKAAGGARPDANLDAINLAALLEDGKQLYVPTHKEHPTGGSPDQIASLSSTISPSEPSTGRRRASKTKGDGAANSGRSAGHRAGKLRAPGDGKVNLNTADLEELQRLPGVGPAMAQRILDYRSSLGGFANVEQLLIVTGLGQKKFEAIAPFVFVK